VGSRGYTFKVRGWPTTKVVEALNISRELARIVERCHEAGVGHRDIKPDNIIIDPSTSHLILVDFGTAWYAAGEDGPDAFRTDWGQELGNWFLRIPDLAAGRDRRDLRKDLVFIVGVLFYLLTGRTPRVLADERTRPPHESLAESVPDSLTSSSEWKFIKRFFEVGFQASIDHRFGSVRVSV
jgi:serine/threonine-protein kinase